MARLRSPSNCFYRNLWTQSALITALVLLALSSGVQLRSMKTSHMPVISDFEAQVVSTRDALKGVDPYSVQCTRDIQTTLFGHPFSPTSKRDPEHFDYPAQIVPLVAPVAFVPWKFTEIALFLVLIPGLFSTFYWWTRTLLPGTNSPTILLIAAIALFSWPSVWALRVQQPTIFVAVLITLGWFLLRSGKDWASGIAFGLAIIKPQIGLPITLWLLAWSVRHRRWAFPISFAATFTALTLLSDRLVPGWIGPWIKNLHSYSRMSRPIWIYIFGPREGWAIVAALSIWSVFVLARMLDAPADSRRFSVAVSLALASTIAVIPVYSAQIYNNIFLFPALLLLLSSCGTGPVARIFRVAAFATSSLMIVAPVLGAPFALAFPSVRIPALLLFACMPMIVFVFPAAMLGNKLSFETHNHATPSSGCIGATRPRSGGR